eukprot:CAMPEP_0181206436 /NCGR_PEP_ID=MMETSP1096-20121128/21034_1 /TAXON_ID=156174 ORGANISM="Chrysochromulina ericina, Strain CCMP281" /NCGR_SAMPLE_ID=MMETSP1096 /ASSEMBLY_ACC=CAM_ASM_000453 /LENGTH=66 /DNA_ID=CAMNT_0023297335 /DNA_START=236 /DNA_END=436 /DNA_ORIENTATION=-
MASSNASTAGLTLRSSSGLARRGSSRTSRELMTSSTTSSVTVGAVSCRSSLSACNTNDVREFVQHS